MYRAMVGSMTLATMFALSACTTTYVVEPPPESPTKHAGGAASGILVIPGTDLGRPCVIVGVLDFHTDAENEDKGFAEMRKYAVALGADAVIQAEFEHGDKGEPSHLSGMAVRYSVRDERPYVVLGTIDVATPEDAQDKGYDEMRAKGTALHADRIIDVTFDHGTEGGQSHLRGVAIRYKR
jgi:uncharacterized protein YbjQ (UPF0145 family)